VFPGHMEIQQQQRVGSSEVGRRHGSCSQIKQATKAALWVPLPFPLLPPPPYLCLLVSILLNFQSFHES
jgi:hypothetical protein